MQSFAGAACEYVRLLGPGYDFVGPPLLGRAVLAAADHMKQPIPRNPIDPAQFRDALQYAREYLQASQMFPLLDFRAFRELGEYSSIYLHCVLTKCQYSAMNRYPPPLA